jgi:hypothetical protein
VDRHAQAHAPAGGQSEKWSTEEGGASCSIFARASNPRLRPTPARRSIPGRPEDNWLVPAPERSPPAPSRGQLGAKWERQTTPDDYRRRHTKVLVTSEDRRQAAFFRTRCPRYVRDRIGRVEADDGHSTQLSRDYAAIPLNSGDFESYADPAYISTEEANGLLVLGQPESAVATLFKLSLLTSRRTSCGQSARDTSQSRLIKPRGPPGTCMALARVLSSWIWALLPVAPMVKGSTASALDIRSGALPILRVPRRRLGRYPVAGASESRPYLLRILSLPGVTGMDRGSRTCRG